MEIVAKRYGYDSILNGTNRQEKIYLIYCLVEPMESTSLSEHSQKVYDLGSGLHEAVLNGGISEDAIALLKALVNSL